VPRIIINRFTYVDQKTDGGTVYIQILINEKLKTGKRGEKQSWLGEAH